MKRWYLCDTEYTTQRFVHARYLAFFCLDFYAGDRGFTWAQFLRGTFVPSQTEMGWLFCHTFGKTLGGGGKCKI